MMLRACTDTEDIIIGLHPTIKIQEASDGRKLLCPNCKQRVFFRNGPIRIQHFAHHRKPNTHACVDTYSEPESLEHLRMKRAVIEFLRTLYPDAVIRPEEWIETGQRVDVLLLMNNQRVAFEVQKMPISPKQWLERHTAYERAGIHDIWLMYHQRVTFLPPLSNRDLQQEHELIGLHGTAVTIQLQKLERAMLSHGYPLMFLNADPDDQPPSCTYLVDLPSKYIEDQRYFHGIKIDCLLHETSIKDGRLVYPALDEALQVRKNRQTHKQHEVHTPTIPNYDDDDTQDIAEIESFEERLASLREEWRQLEENIPTTKLWQSLAQQYDLTLPLLKEYRIFGVPIFDSSVFSCAALLWQAAIYYTFIHNKPRGAASNVQSIRTFFRKFHPELLKQGRSTRAFQPVDPIQQYLMFLRDIGLLERMPPFTEIHAEFRIISELSVLDKVRIEYKRSSFSMVFKADIKSQLRSERTI